MNIATSASLTEADPLGNTHQDFDDSACSCAGQIPWNYTRNELHADLMVHIAGLCLGPVAVALLIRLALIYCPVTEALAVCIYAAALLAALLLSAAYNTWPISRTKWMLRRFYHSAIYVLIAATYTPFLVEAKNRTAALAVLVGVWCLAAAGMAIKLLLPGRFDRSSIGVYLAMGWSVVIFWQDPSILPLPSHRFILLGGALYTIGVLFHVSTKLRFQNAVWHFFVLIGAACHYGAVVSLVLT